MTKANHFGILAVLLAAVVAAGVVVALAGTRSAEAAFPGQNGRIAFERNGDIFTINPDGSGETNLTPGTASVEVNPAFNNEGTKIAFQSTRPAADGTTDFEVYTMNADGSGVVQVTDNAVQDHTPVFSPDGAEIAYGKEDAGSTDIYKTSAVPGGTEVPLATGTHSEEDPSWSPDGQRIAYVDFESANRDIYTMDASDGANKEVFVSGPSSQASPNWSPSGDRIAYADTVSLTDGSFDAEIWSAPFPRTDPPNGFRQLTDNAFNDEWPTYSPAGDQIAFARLAAPGSNYDIWTMSSADDGTNADEIPRTANAAPDFTPDWGEFVSPPPAKDKCKKKKGKRKCKKRG